MAIITAKPPYGATVVNSAESPLLASGSVIKLKNNSLTGEKFSKTTFSGSHQTISGSMSWVPDAGVYMMVYNSSDIQFELFVEGSWQAGIAGSGLYIMDGSTRRFSNTGGLNHAVYYHRL